MNKGFRIYGLLVPYILFINVLSFGSGSLGIGTLLLMSIMSVILLISLLFIGRVKIHNSIFLTLSSFYIISLIKLFVYNSGEIGVSFMMGGIGNWLFFLMNFLFSALFFKNSVDKMAFIRMLSYMFLLSSIIGIVHYYFFYSIPFMDSSYGSDESGTIFNVADYDLMRFRESSIFFGANVNAYMTVMGYIFLVFSLIKNGIIDVLKSPVYWFGLIVHCWNIFISDSRSGILLILILTMFLFYDKRVGANLRIPFWIRIIAMMMAFGGMLIYIQNQPRLQLDVLLTDERFLKISVGILILLKSPINLLIGAPINDKWTIGDISVSDNMYIAILLYVGVIGLLFLIWAFYLILKKLNKSIISNDEYRYSLMVKYFVFYFLLVGMFAIPIGMMPFMIYFGIILGGVNYSFKKK